MRLVALPLAASIELVAQMGKLSLSLKMFAMLSRVKRLVGELCAYMMVFSSSSALALDLQNYRCEAGKELSRLKGENLRTMFFTYHNGYLIQNRHGGSMTKVWDIDDPVAPKLINSYDSNLWEGQHTHTFIGETELFHWAGLHQIDLSQLPALKEADPIFNATDMVNSYYPFGFADVANSYQYQQVGYFSIHDLRTPDQEKLSTVPILADTGFEGHVNLIGNLMIVTGDNESPEGVATYDLSDPAHPVLLDSIRTTADGTPLIKAYDSVPIWGSYVVLAQNGDTTAQRGVDIIDFSDPKNLKHVGRFDFEGRTRYAQFQDHYMFIGDAKVDMHTFKTVATFPEGGGEYTLPVGNLLITAGMHRPDNGRIWCHQAAPDHEPPAVLFTSPAHNATGIPITSRVGVVIPETLDIKTINTNNIVLRPLHQPKVAVDIVSTDHDVINVTPKQLLKPNTTYELIIFAGGLSDIAGNTLPSDFRLVFSTGDAINTQHPPVIQDFVLDSDSCVGCEPISMQLKSAAHRGELVTSIDWGDGHTDSQPNGETFRHSYQKPGIFTVQAKVTDREGLTDHATGRVIIAEPNIHASLNSSTVITSRSGLIWNVNPDNNSVSALDFSTGQRRFNVAVPANPRSLVEDSQGRLWVVSEDKPAITVINGSTGDVINSLALPVGSRPQAIVHHPKQAIAYVSAMGNGKIYRVNTQTLTLDGELPVGPWPRAMAMTHDGRKLFVTRFISPDHQGEVYAIDTEAFATTSTIALAMDTHPDSDRNGGGLPNYLMSLAVAPDGNTLWVGSSKVNIFRGGMRDGHSLSFENSVRSIISFIDIEHETELNAKRVDLDNHELPSAIQFDSRGAIAYVSFRGNNSVTAYDAKTLQIIDRVDVGKTPIGIAVDHNDQLYIHNYLSRNIMQATIKNGPHGSLGAFATTHAMTTIAEEKLSDIVLHGKQLFNDAQNARISRDGYISCASCHLDGEHDGRVWDFFDRGEGLRNTIDLRGKAGAAHGRMHWSANFDEIQDFEHDIRNAFAGRGLLNDSDLDSTIHPLDAAKATRSTDLDALAAYVSSLSQFGISPYRDDNGQLSKAARAGQELFQSLNCSHCHSGEAFTDSPMGYRHNVGTLKITSGMRLASAKLNAIDTPTLKGLWSTAPYFHDGSAKTLSEVLNQPHHGNAQLLSMLQQEQLIAYLLQIDDLERFPVATENAALPEFTVSSIVENATLTSRLVTFDVAGIREDTQQVTYYANDLAIAVADKAPFHATWLTDSPGRQRIYAVATHADGSQTASRDRWVNIAGNSLTCEIGQSQFWTGGFVVKDIKVTNVGINTMRDWQVNFQFTDDVVYREAWDTIVQQESARQFLAKGYTDDRDLKPGESIAFGFIVNHEKEKSDIETRCVVTNPIVPRTQPQQRIDGDMDGVADSDDACPHSALGLAVNKLGCAIGELDWDSDGVVNAKDACPFSEHGAAINALGCSQLQYHAQH